jgi:hypothetical protein
MALSAIVFSFVILTKGKDRRAKRVAERLPV